MTRLLRLGALAGLVGGLAMGLFLLAVGESSIADAIALEHASGEPHDEMFSRGTQVAGGVAGAAISGVLFGLVLAVVLAAVRHRLAARDDWRRAVLVALAGFVTLALVPALKYPANPPAVGDPDTVGRRTTLYLILLAWSVLSAWGGWRVALWLRSRTAPDHVRLTAAAATFVALVAVGFVVLPGTPDAVEAPATLVWRFRLAALGGAAVLWAVAGTVLGALLVSSTKAAAALSGSGTATSRTG
ncbi:MAG TPA: CbtA family protein [Acidimicrobiales bacterium]|nr:CbtA family protein [Acidimicrobiales bacterium]